MTSERPRWFTILLVLLVCTAAIVIGVVVALRITTTDSSSTTGQTVPRFSQVELGSLETRATQTTTGHLNLVSRSSYRITDRLGIKVHVESTATEPIAASVRLLDEQGLVQTLDPSTITLTAGTSGYCCWTIGAVGKYTFQLFRPDGTIISLPVTIRDR